MNDLREKYGSWALVTGGTSGIGEAFAAKLASEGFNLVLVARRKERLDEWSQELSSRYGVELCCLPLDLSRPDGLAPLFDVCRELDVGLVVNNAGSGTPGEFHGQDVTREIALVRLNCIAPMEITHHFLPGMMERGRGGVILVSSLMGFQGVPYMANYSATKGYLLNLGESLYHECKPSGVDVLVLAPGATETPGKYLHEVDYSKLPVSWMSSEVVVETALRKLGRKAFVIPGLRNYLTACLSGGLWSRGLVQGLMRRIAKFVLPGIMTR